jgi:phosphoribosylamine-glycine ligase
LLQSEGHEVDFWLDDERGKNLYRGLVPQVKDWKAGLDKDTVLIFDMSKMGKEADACRKKGFKVIGGSELADTLELDRAFGLSVADNHGIAIPPSEEFTDFQKAIEHIADSDAGWVFKPNDNKDGVRTTVCTSSEQMAAMLEHYADLWKGSVSFVLQEVVQGVEVSSEVWCVNGVIVPNSYNNTLEQKRLMPGDKGPNTGCMGSTVKFNLCPRLYDLTFGKLLPWLKQVRYSGPLDINCIIDPDGKPWMLEWTPRFGYSAIYAMLEGLNMPLGEFLETMAAGQMPALEPSDEWLGALRLTMPPYPHCEDAPETEGIPILGLDLEDENVWPLDLMVDGDKLVCSGFDGIVCEVSGADESLEAMWGNLYGMASQIQIPECQYRIDNLQDVQQRIEQLDDAGMIGEVE